MIGELPPAEDDTFLNADKVEYDDSEDFNNSKILVQDISIKALRMYLTFRIQQIENALGVQGIG